MAYFQGRTVSFREGTRTLSETNSKFAPEIGWLEDDQFLLERLPLPGRWELLVSGRVNHDFVSTKSIGRSGLEVGPLPFSTWRIIPVRKWLITTG